MLPFMLAALLMIALPVLAATGVFFMTLPRWIDRILKSDPRVHERLRLEVSENSFGWTVAPNQLVLQRLPYAPLAYAVLAACTMTAVETVVFALGSGVPRFWYVSGILATATVIVLTIACGWLLKTPLRRLDRARIGATRQRPILVCGSNRLRYLEDNPQD